MPKGEKPQRQDAAKRTLRKREMRPDDVREVAAKLRKLAGEIEVLAAEVENYGMKEIDVDGAGKPERASALMRQFIGKLKVAIDNELSKTRP